MMQGWGGAVGVVIPALNEEATVGAVVTSVTSLGVGIVVVVDNGSTDTTARVAAAAGATVVREPRRGYGRACQRGLAALPSCVDAIVFLDADGSDDVSILPRLVRPILDDAADLVVSARVATPGALTAAQRFGNALAVRWLQLRFGMCATDLGPFRAVRRDVLPRLRMADGGYGWTIEMQIKVARCGYRYLEIPVSYRPRRAGISKISGTLRGTIGAGAKILGRLAYHDLLHYVSPGRA